MSRSNPNDRIPNPAVRWHEWDGENGTPRYYDKDKEKRISLPKDFTFILLDQLSTVKGFHEKSQSGIFSNEVRDTRNEPMTVKSFKGGLISQGFYQQIREKVAASGGCFVSNCYIGFKLDKKAKALTLGSFQFKGAALSAWFEFVKENRAEIYKQAVHISGSKHMKKGKIEYEIPLFELIPISEKTDAEAKALDVALQDYLKKYFARTRLDQVAQDNGSQNDAPSDVQDNSADDVPDKRNPDDDDVPF